MKASVWRVRLESAAPPPPDSMGSCGRGAAATAAIAVGEGKCEVIVFLVILTVFLHFFVLDRDCLSKKKKRQHDICARARVGKRSIHVQIRLILVVVLR